MKTKSTLHLSLLTAVACTLSPGVFAQLNNGGFHANFGVDADTKANYIKYGTAKGMVNSDDWFSLSNDNKGVIDTTNAAYYRALLKEGRNIAFVKRMAQPLYHKAANAMWIDAVYARDFIKADSLHLDTTAFVSSSKNAEDPAAWLGGPAGVSNKNDILEVLTHMRRSGNHINDSLWLFTAASMVGTTGSKYYDVELYKNNLGYDAAAGRFASGGPDEGHTQWKFDNQGNITQTGDLIIAVTYNPGEAPVIEVRIWVARSTFAAVNPALFSFSAQFDANSNKSQFGYASIVSKAGTTAFGSGAGNYSSTATDTTYSSPWGTIGKSWSENYEPLQLVEVGINLTRIGIDPNLYATLGSTAACGSFFKSILYKSRSSASFSSSLNDFVGPLDFMRIPVLDYKIQSDTLSCRKTQGALQVSTQTTAGQYNWKSLNGGNIIGSNTDSSDIKVNRSGNYVLQGKVAAGCPVGRTDTVVVLTDSLKPVATAQAGLNILGQALLVGGDPVASNFSTPFGNSKGLTFSWSGPQNFTSLLQSPIVATWGTYDLTVTEKRNGCTSSANIAVAFGVLATGNLSLSASRTESRVDLQWKAAAGKEVVRYEVERSEPGGGFRKIGSLAPANATVHEFVFADHQPGAGTRQYRIREVSGNGLVAYSNVVAVAGTADTRSGSPYASIRNGDRLYLVIRSEEPAGGTISLYDFAGALVGKQAIQVVKGENTIAVSCSKTLLRNKPYILTTSIGRQLPVSRKIVF